MDQVYFNEGGQSGQSGKHSYGFCKVKEMTEVEIILWHFQGGICDNAL